MVAALSVFFFAASGPPAAGSGELGIMWKLVVLFGVGAVVLFWLLRRLAGVVAKRRTDQMIRKVVSESERVTEKDLADDDR